MVDAQCICDNVPSLCDINVTIESNVTNKHEMTSCQYCTLLINTLAMNIVISKNVNIHLEMGCGVHLSKYDWYI